MIESDPVLNIAFHYLTGGSRLHDIEQLKNGVSALAAASDSLFSNGALMVIPSLARDLKAIDSFV
jgi:hypothetical protein